MSFSKMSPCLTTASNLALFVDGRFVSTIPCTRSTTQFNRPVEMKRKRSLCPSMDQDTSHARLRKGDSLIHKLGTNAKRLRHTINSQAPITLQQLAICLDLQLAHKESFVPTHQARTGKDLFLYHRKRAEKLGILARDECIRQVADFDVWEVSHRPSDVE